jgi:ribonuclease BN (tRNA processing enzyme)
VRMTVVGCTGSMPGPDSPASCYLVEHDGFRVLLDLGNGALGALMRHVDLLDVDAVVLSHLHGDHFIDMTSLYVARKYGPYSPGTRLPVLGPEATSHRLADAYGMRRDPGMSDSFEFRALNREVEVGPFRLRTARMAHPVETYAVRLDAGGRALVYTGDTGPNDALPALAEGADLLLAEASFVDGEDNPPDLHLTGRDAGEAAGRAGVGSLLVTHVPPWNEVAVAVGEAAAVFGGTVTAAAPGMVLDVGR